MNDTNQTQVVSSNNSVRNGNGTGNFHQYLTFKKVTGYVSDFREVPNTSPKVYSVNISVLQGEESNKNFVPFQLYVKPADALSLFWQYSGQINDEKTKVTVRFVASNIKPKAYVGKSGKNEGQIVPYLSGSLVIIYNMKVNGEVVFSRYTDKIVSENKENNTSETNSAVIREESDPGFSMEDDNKVAEPSDSENTAPSKAKKATPNKRNQKKAA